MKRLIVALLLVVVLSLTLATPAFADDGTGNMPGKAADLGLWAGLENAVWHLWWGLVMGNAHPAYPACAGAWFALDDVISGQPPAKPHWASGPK